MGRDRDERLAHGGILRSIFDSHTPRERSTVNEDSNRAGNRIMRGGGTVVLAFALVAVGYGIGRVTTSPSTSPSTSVSTSVSTSSRRVLWPATVPPHVAECSKQLLYYEDGNATPLFCSNGDINVLAWRYFALMYPLVMMLGPDANPSEVKEALCADLDLNHSTAPIETSAYQLSIAYYGWKYVGAGMPSPHLWFNGCASS